jgi:hypothetical protein
MPNKYGSEHRDANQVLRAKAGNAKQVWKRQGNKGEKGEDSSAKNAQIKTLHNIGNKLDERFVVTWSRFAWGLCLLCEHPV